MKIGATYLFLVCAAALLSACGTPSATVHTSRGEDLMLLGFDPVAYFTDGKPVRGTHTLPATVEGRTYYFATPEHRAAFERSPAKYEPQYGGFCSNGAPYAVKLGSDPTQFEIRGGRLFIFGDVQGHEMWLLDWQENIQHADALWASIRDKGYRAQTLRAWIIKVPWYRTTPELTARWHAAHPGETFIHYPGRSVPYDTGGGWNNIVLKYPGWRAREGFGQPALGVPGEADDPGKSPSPLEEGRGEGK